MLIDKTQVEFRFSLARVATALIAACIAVGATAQEPTDKEPPAKEEAEAAKPDEEPAEAKKSPFVVPDGGPEALIQFVDTVKRARPQDPAERVEFLKFQIAAIQEASERLIKSEDAEIQARGYQEKIVALSALARFEIGAAKEISELIETLAESESTPLARVGKGYQISTRAAALRTMSDEEQAAFVQELIVFVDTYGVDVTTYSLANQIARILSNPELGAQLYEGLAPAMRESDDERLRSRADNMLGAARRLRLPGNFMELNGRTAEGEDFDWAAYRGKVVLVDFWASWCGPCRGEIPNMKANLEAYGEKGFAIVGINLDNSHDKYRQYVEQEGLTWTNLMSDKEEEMGWNNPIATHYGISGIPTAILVDQEGKVVSLAARGGELNRLLKEMLGEPEADSDASVEGSAEAGE